MQFGRGGDTNYHIGNHRFRVLADEHRQEYRSSSRKEKALVVQEVVRCWRARGGRFLAKTNPEKGDESLWHDVGDDVAKKKAAKILSEKSPQEKSKSKDERNKGRKRPAVDSIDADQAPKAPTLFRPAVAGTQSNMATKAAGIASCSMPICAAASIPTAAASLPRAAAASLLQPPPPPPQPPVQPRLQLPLSLLQPPLQNPMAGTGALGLTSNSLLRDLLGLRGNPLTVSSLAIAAGLSSADSDLSRYVLAAQAIAQQEQTAASAKMALANAFIGDLRVSTIAQLLAPATNPAPPPNLIPGAGALINALRLGLTPDQLRLLLSVRASGEEHKSNDDSNHNHAERRSSDRSPG